MKQNVLKLIMFTNVNIIKGLKVLSFHWCWVYNHGTCIIIKSHSMWCQEVSHKYNLDCNDEWSVRRVAKSYISISARSTLVKTCSLSTHRSRTRWWSVACGYHFRHCCRGGHPGRIHYDQGHCVSTTECSASNKTQGNWRISTWKAIMWNHQETRRRWCHWNVQCCCWWWFWSVIYHTSWGSVHPRRCRWWWPNSGWGQQSGARRTRPITMFPE